MTNEDDVGLAALAQVFTLDRVFPPYMTRPTTRRGRMLIDRGKAGVWVGRYLVTPVTALELSVTIYAVAAGPAPSPRQQLEIGSSLSVFSIERDGELVRVSVIRKRPRGGETRVINATYRAEAALEFAAALAVAARRSPPQPP